MKLTSPIFRLKAQAKTLARDRQLPFHTALDKIAQSQGFASWSLLASHHAKLSPVAKIYLRLKPGTLVLIGARPGQGKTRVALELGCQLAVHGRKSTFFTLESTEKQCRELLSSMGLTATGMEFDDSDQVSAAYVVEKLKMAQKGDLAILDYLQILDQDRSRPDLATQVHQLRSFAKSRGVTFLILSQIKRTFDPSEQCVPSLSDVRLPNPLDLNLFDQTCFLHNGEILFKGVSKTAL